MDSKRNTAGTELAHTLGRGVDRASVGAHDSLNQLSDAAIPAMDRMASTVAATAHDAIDTVAGAATSAVQTLGIKGDQLNNVQETLMAGARTYVRKQPIASLGIAMAVGWVLGRLTR